LLLLKVFGYPENQEIRHGLDEDTGTKATPRLPHTQQAPDTGFLRYGRLRRLSLQDQFALRCGNARMVLGEEILAVPERHPEQTQYRSDGECCLPVDLQGDARHQGYGNGRARRRTGIEHADSE